VCRYAEVQQLFHVLLVVAQSKCGFVLVVRFFLPHTGDDVIIAPSTAARQRLSNKVCMFVDDIHCKVAFVEMSEAGVTEQRRRWAALDSPP